MSESDDIPTSSSILGPFWSPHAPFRELGGSICQDPHKGKVTLMHGKVIDLVTKKGIPNAVVDIWQASANGKYDFQDPENQTPNNLRGKFRTNADGEYYFYCLKPTAYSLPTDGKEIHLLAAWCRWLTLNRPCWCSPKTFGSSSYASSTHTLDGKMFDLLFWRLCH